MRAHFYTPQQVKDSFDRWAPHLRRYAEECRRVTPLVNIESLTASERGQVNVLIEVYKDFRNTQRYFRSPHLFVYHGSMLSLLAASHVLGTNPHDAVVLLSEEWWKWLKDIFAYSDADDWFSPCWITINERIPDNLRPIGDELPAEEGVEYWLVSKARHGWTCHDLWAWHGWFASFVKMVGEEVEEA